MPYVSLISLVIHMVYTKPLAIHVVSRVQIVYNPLHLDEQCNSQCPVSCFYGRYDFHQFQCLFRNYFNFHFKGRSTLCHYESYNLDHGSWTLVTPIIFHMLPQFIVLTPCPLTAFIWFTQHIAPILFILNFGFITSTSQPSGGLYFLFILHVTHLSINIINIVYGSSLSVMSISSSCVV